MNILKKDQSRAEIILVAGFIVLFIVVVARIFGPEIKDFFFGAGSHMQVAGTERDNELLGDKSEQSTTEDEQGQMLEKIDPNMYGNEEALARMRYQQQMEKRAKLQSMILWTFALVTFVAVLGLIGWKTFKIIREIRIKNIE